MSQRNRFKLIVYICLLVVAIGFLIWWSIYMAAKGRDYERIGDMKVLQYEMINYYSRFNTYIIPECSSNSLINFCSGAGDRVLNVSSISDPLASGKYNYVVGFLAEDDFSINFSLERGVNGIPPGDYVLTKNGIAR